jgi:polysaccharide export outer membrane protein
MIASMYSIPASVNSAALSYPLERGLGIGLRWLSDLLLNKQPSTLCPVNPIRRRVWAGRRLGAEILVTILLATPLVCVGQAATAPPSPTVASSTTRASAGTTGLTDEPIYPGELVNVDVFGAPDLSTSTRVSQGGDIAVPYLGVIHIAGLTSATASDLITKGLKESDQMRDPRVMVTVDSTTTGITILGEVRSPGVFSPPGKRLLSDMLAMAGGLTSSAGRVLEISSEAAPEQKTLIAWDPTLHNTASLDRFVYPGQRILVKPCGLIYVGGNVTRPGAYPICGSQQIKVSQAIALAGGLLPATYQSHTILVRPQPDGSRIVLHLDLAKVLRSQKADPVVQDDDIIFAPPSGLKLALLRMPDYAATLASELLYVYH